MDEKINVKKGYLNEEFKYFHLKDKKSTKFEFHYHDFNKIIIFISGNVTYLIEGKAYKLKSWDILFIGSNDIHKPVIDSEGTYERIIIWINSSFLKKQNDNDCNLLACFEKASSDGFNLLRLSQGSLGKVRYIISQLENACNSNEFGSHVLQNSLFLQLIVYMNRLFLGIDKKDKIGEVEYDENISAVLKYINENLIDDLAIDSIASHFYINKYYLMHSFKKQTGYTIHSYIIKKRLIMANNLVKSGNSIGEACIRAGFGDYSSFVRAFKNIYGLSPQKYYREVEN